MLRVKERMKVEFSRSITLSALALFHRTDHALKTVLTNRYTCTPQRRPFFLFVAVHQLGPLLLRPKEACQENSGVKENSGVRGEFRCQRRIPVSGHLFARRTTTTARLMDDAETMGNDLDPVLCTVGPATAHRRPHAIQLLGRLFPTDLPSPAGPTFRLSATELLPFRERAQDGIGMPGAMAAVARPGRLARIGHHRGPHRVGLDVPQNDEQGGRRPG